jgi:hypothetical protein
MGFSSEVKWSNVWSVLTAAKNLKACQLTTQQMFTTEI